MDAASFLKVSAASIRRWTDAGLLHTSRLGRRRARRFREEDLLRFMEDSQGRHPASGTRVAPAGLQIQDLTIPMGSHLVTLYSGESGRARLALPFLRDGLLRGQTCFLLSSPAVRDQYVQALRRRKVDVGATIRSGMLTFLPNRPAPPDERIASLDHALTEAASDRGGPIRFVAEHFGGHLSVRSVPRLLILEQGLTALSKRFPIVMLCAYDCRGFAGTTVLEILKLHFDTFEHRLGYFLT